MPYRAVLLDYTFFKDFTKNEIYHSIRPGRVAGDPTVVDLRAIKYTPEGRIFYKLNFDENYQEMQNRKRTTELNSTFDFPPLYRRRPRIPKDKWTDLQSLKSLLPSDTHGYYDDIPHEEQSRRQVKRQEAVAKTEKKRRNMKVKQYWTLNELQDVMQDPDFLNQFEDEGGIDEEADHIDIVQLPPQTVDVVSDNEEVDEDDLLDDSPPKDVPDGADSWCKYKKALAENEPFKMAQRFTAEEIKQIAPHYKGKIEKFDPAKVKSKRGKAAMLGKDQTPKEEPSQSQTKASPRGVPTGFVSFRALPKAM
ncbi:hypothetical protein GE061_015815 [Apolygus lucorum]|uniref:Uncharacterized protein n=1 Tax=Apolygus lucorum TaxID=248454 RepID=A0A8S9XN87_APOLU|nr:hypothetical protein GE061_015815 [Apolygus lucorum]